VGRSSKNTETALLGAIVGLFIFVCVLVFKTLSFIVKSIIIFFETRQKGKTESEPEGTTEPGQPGSITVLKPRLEIQVSTSQKHFSSIKEFFIPSGSPVTVGNYTLPNGMIYFIPQRPPKSEYEEEIEPSAIYPALPIGTGLDWDARSFSYWPSYFQIPPDARNTYLKWLADGAKDPTIGVGYVFIYFYGLERRLVIDCQDTTIAARDRDAVIAEVLRLKEIFGEKSGSFRGYSSRLLEWVNIDSAILKIAEGKNILIEETLENDTLAALKISRAIKEKGYLDAEDTLLWFRNYHPGVGRKYLIRNNFDLVLKGFEPIFEKAYPNGLKPTQTRGVLELNYHAAAMGLHTNRRLEKWPDPQRSFDTRNLLPLLKSLNELLDQLAPHIRWLQSDDGTTSPLEIIAKRPVFLWPDSSKVFSEKLKSLAKESIDPDQKMGCISIKKVLDTLDIESEKISKKDHKMLLESFRNLGFFADPDPDLFDSTLTSEDMIAISEKELPEVKLTKDFKSAILTLKLCAAASWADGKVSSQESNFLKTQLLGSFKISDDQKSRLSLYLFWLLFYDHHLNNFKKMVGTLSKPKKRDVASLMIAIVAIDGTVSPKEVAFLEKSYKAFGLDKDSLYSDLHSYQADGSEAIKSSDETVRINQKKVQRKIEESSAVSSILADVFKDDSPSKDETKEIEQKKRKLTIEPHLARIIKNLLTRDSWPINEAEALMKAEGFLMNGAIERVNEWAFEELGDALLEEEDGKINISQSLKTDAQTLIAEAA